MLMIRFMEQLEEKERIAFEKHQQEQFVKDKRLINDYCFADHKLKVTRTPSGLSYAIQEKRERARLLFQVIQL